MKKLCIICYVPAQISYLKKIEFLKHAVSQSDSRIFKSTVSLEENDEIALFFFMVIQSHERSKFIEKLLDEHGQKCVSPFWSQNFKIG